MNPPFRAGRGLLLRGLPLLASVPLATIPSAAPAATAGPCVPEFVRELEPFPISDFFGPVPNAWHGGWQKARPQLVDIDADGDLDLFVAEENGQLRFYRNDGTASAPDFVLQTDDFAGVHELFFMRFADVDSDGDADLLVEAPPFEVDVGGNTVERTGAYLYTNVGGPLSPQFVNQSPHPDGYLVDDGGEPIAFVTTAPDFVDLEGDGDQDLLLGEPSGGVILYRNVGSPGSPVFQFETASYQNLQIVFGSCNPNRPPADLRGGPVLRHGFMLFTFHDVDGNGAPDLFVGDQFNPNVYYWSNVGGSPSPDFSCQTERFFPDSTGVPGIFPQMLVTTFGDLDGDGDADAIFGPGVIAADDRMHFFRNRGTATAPDYAMEGSGFLTEFDRGRNSAPAFLDLDGDLDLDLFLGTETSGALSFYENDGAPTAADFIAIQPNWIPLPGTSWAAPEFADLDDDGDLDLFVGMALGAVRYWRNDAPGSPDPADWPEITNDADFGDVSDRTFRMNVRSQAVPRFFDEDGDGDLDVLVGQWDFSGQARLLFFRNDGTPPAHDFVLASSDYQGLGVLGQNLAPALADLDFDGDPDLVVGKLDGTLELLRNVGAPGAPSFVPEVAALGGIDVGKSAVPVFVDLDADGDLDLVVGESGGGLNFFRNVTGPAPGAFALLDPPPDAVVSGALSTRFDWESAFGARGSEATYEFRLAPSPSSPPHEWTVRAGLTDSEVTVRLHRTGVRFLPDFWWTVAARSGCAVGPVPEWRHGTHAGFLDDHLELAAQSFGGSAPDPPSSPPAGAAITNVFPSPTTDRAEISYAVPRPGPVRVEVFDLAGRRVAVLRDGREEAGRHTVTWNGRTGSGTAVAPGVYLVRLVTPEGTESRRVVRLR